MGKVRGDQQGRLSRIANNSLGGYSPRSSATGFSASPKPAARTEPRWAKPDQGKGCTRAAGIRAWKAD
jgi:hypothetical protein